MPVTGISGVGCIEHEQLACSVHSGLRHVPPEHTKLFAQLLSVEQLALHEPGMGVDDGEYAIG